MENKMKPYTLRQIRDGQSAGFRYMFHEITIGPALPKHEAGCDSLFAVSDKLPCNCKPGVYSADFISAQSGVIGTLSGDPDVVTVTCEQIEPNGADMRPCRSCARPCEHTGGLTPFCDTYCEQAEAAALAVTK